jgi:hypothetical protein
MEETGLNVISFLKKEEIITGESWSPVEGFDGYFISNKGRVFTSKLKQYKIMKTSPCRLGYISLHLSIGHGITKNCKIHRLVAIAFLENTDSTKKEINHKDGNKENNSAENLEWCTRKENMRHAVSSGLKKSSKGERHGMSKLAGKDIENIRWMWDIGFDHKFLSTFYGVHFSTVYRIVNEKIWKHIP